MSEERANTIGIFYAWWRGDPLDRLPPAPGLTVEAVESTFDLSAIEGLNASDATDLMTAGHRLYVARLDGQIAAHGWSATRHASIGELGVDMTLAPDERYLWGFETCPASRGKGVYTRMLQHILTVDTDADRVWIGHDIGNEPSARGILRAGFRPVGEVFKRPDGELRYVITGNYERGLAASTLLGIPIDPGE